MTEPRAPASQQQWRAEVERALRGAPFSSLVAQTLDGLEIAPLYTEHDRPAEEGIPWLPRAPRALGAVRDASVLGVLDEERRAGTSFVWVRDDGLRIAEMRPAPDAEGPELLLEADANEHEQHLLAVASAGVRVALDPFVVLAHPGAAIFDGIAGAMGRGAAVLAARGTCSLLAVGAGDEIALATASLVASLRALEARSVPLAKAVALSTIVVEVGTDFFVEIAKLRALRRVLARALDAAGIAARPVVAARTSERTLSTLDQPTNVLRSTLGASAALIGGADVIAVLPHDSLREAQPLGARLARNTPLVLALESHLDAPADPARGSYYVEHLTRALARQAWSALREIEGAGGLPRGIEAVVPRLEARREAQARAVATRRAPLVGVSRFPSADPGAPAAGPARDAEPFERLRQRGRGIPARVIAVPGCPATRVDFARELASIAFPDVSVAGLEGDHTAGLAGDPAAGLGGASIVILCGADADLATTVAAAARAAKAAGARAVAIAAKPGAHEAALRSAGADAFVHLGADVVAALGSLIDLAEAPR